MARPRMPEHIHLRSARMLDVVTGELVTPGDLLIEGERIMALAPTSVPDDALAIDLGDLTLLPGLMDMEVNLLLGGPDHRSPLNAVQDDPAVRTLRAVANARRTLRAGFTTVRNLGLFIQTGGLLLDVALKKAIDLGWIEGPRVVPAGHAITPTGGHLDPTMFQAFAPHIMPLTVEEGIANGVSEVRKAVRYQIKHGAQFIKVLRLGRGDVTHRPGRGPAVLRRGARGHRRRGPSGRAPGCGPCPRRRRHPGRPRRRHRLHRARLADDATRRSTCSIELGRFLVPTTYLADGMDVSHAAPELQAKAAEVFPRAKETIRKADRPRGPHRLRHRRSGHPPRQERQGAAWPWSTGA